MRLISSVGDFLNVVNELYPEKGDAFFRGQLSSEQDVSSSIFRFMTKFGSSLQEDNHGSFSEEVFKSFEEKLPAYSESCFLKNYPANEIDILMTAQHYGMPTRLIDLTSNPLVALYFASENEGDGDYMSVFILKPTDDCSLRILNSSSVVNEIECNRSAINKINFCVDKCYYLIIKSSVSDDRMRDCIKAIGDTIWNIREVINNSFYIDGSKDLISFQGEESDNFVEFCQGKVEEIARLSEKLCDDSDFDALKINLKKIVEEMRSHSLNHTCGPSGVNMYGKDHLIIEPLPINNRIKNQQGFFLFSKKCGVPEFKSEYFVSKKNSIKSIHDINDKVRQSSIVRVDICRKFSKKIMQELSRYGIKKSFIYPELSSFSEEIKERILSSL